MDKNNQGAEVALIDDLEELTIQKLEKILDDSSTDIKAELAVTNKLTPVAQQYEKLKLEMRETVKQIKTELKRNDEGMKSFNAHKSRFLSKLDCQACDKEIEDFQSALKNFKPEKPMQMESIQSYYDVPEIVTDSLYIVATKLYQEGHYQESADIFFFLTNLCCYFKDYWAGLGLAEQSNGHDDIAISAFDVMSRLDDKDPVPHILCAESHLAKKDKEMAKNKIELAKTLNCASHPIPEELQAMFAGLQTSVNN